MRGVTSEPPHTSIHVVARLFRMPILRIDGDVLLVDDDRLGHTTGQGRAPTARQELTACCRRAS